MQAKPLRFPGIRATLVLVTVLAILPSMLIIVGSGIEFGEYLAEEVRLGALRQAESLALIQEQISGSIREILSTLANIPVFHEADLGEREQHLILSLMQDILVDNPELHNMALTDLEGRVLVSPGFPAGTDLGDRRHVRRALQSGEFSSGEYIVSRAVEAQVFAFAHPVRDRHGRPVGILTATYDISFYSGVFDHLDIPPQAILSIADHAGIRVFFHPPKATNPLGMPVNDGVWEAIRRGGDLGIILQRGSDGIRRYYAFRKLRLPHEDEPYMHIVVGIPEQTAAAPIRKVLTRNLGFMTAAALAAVLIALFLGRAVFLRRLDVLALTAARIQGGDMSARTDLKDDPTEIGRVARALDLMADRLEQRERERNQAEWKLSFSLHEKETLLREIHHRVKNNLQLMLSIVRLQGGDDSALQDFCRRLEARIQAMAGVHELLYQTGDFGAVDAAELLRHLARLHGVAFPDCEPTIAGASIMLSLEQAVPLALLANELITNACKHGLKEGQPRCIGLTLHREGREAILVVQDNGPGFPPGFNAAGRGGLGLQIVTSLGRQLGGDMDWENRQGARVTLRFPIVSSPGG